MSKRTICVLGAVASTIVLASCGGDPFAKSMYTEQPEIVTYQEYLASNADLPPEGTSAVLAVGSEKAEIKKGSLVFKDSDGDGKLDKYEDWRLPVHERASDLVSQMSPEEKLGLLSWGENTGVDGMHYANTAFEFPPLDEARYNNNLQGLVERGKWGIPYVLGADPAHDGWTGDELAASQLSQWPYYSGLGALDDLAVTKDFGETVAAEFRMRGCHLIFGTSSDAASEPGQADVHQLFHSDPDIAASHISVMIKALQGGDELTPTGIAISPSRGHEDGTPTEASLGGKLDEAAIHSLEIQFKLGLFENPYVDLAKAATFWDPAGNMMKLRLAAGKRAMSKSIILAENREVATGILTVPVLATNADYLAVMDTNKNGTFDVFFDSAYPDADSGQAKSKAFSNDVQYLGVNFVDRIEKADMLVARNFSPGAALSGPESKTIVERTLAAKKKNPGLKIVVGITASRPGIVSSFAGKVDALYIDFAATDSAFLDVVFWQDGIEPKGHLPFAIPADDVGADTANPAYEVGYGLGYAALGGYGYGN